MSRVAVFASGRGSNLGALVAAQAGLDSYRVALVATNVAGCGALSAAHEAGIEALCLPSRGLPRLEHDLALLEAVRIRDIDMICLAGYMRVLGREFIDGFDGPILNIHPSLLPAFPGMHAQRQALEAGVRWTGATAHLVDAGLDTGPILVQEPVKVEPDDDEASLSRRILAVEHRLYPAAADIVARKAFVLNGRKVRLLA